MERKERANPSRYTNADKPAAMVQAAAFSTVVQTSRCPFQLGAQTTNVEDKLDAVDEFGASEI